MSLHAIGTQRPGGSEDRHKVGQGKRGRNKALSLGNGAWCRARQGGATVASPGVFIFFAYIQEADVYPKFARRVERAKRLRKPDEGTRGGIIDSFLQKNGLTKKRRSTSTKG